MAEKYDTIMLTNEQNAPSHIALQYKLDAYEGPLDLLLSLIAKNKSDITGVPTGFY